MATHSCNVYRLNQAGTGGEVIMYIHPFIRHQEVIRGQVAEAAVSAGGPRLSFPWPHQPALTGGFPRHLQAIAEI